MKNKFIVLSTVIFVLIAYKTKAQQMPSIGMFFKSQLYYNPAYAGSGEGIRATVLHRAMWKTLRGAPSTQLFLIDGPLGKNIGSGLVISRDQIGNLRQYDIMANGSYRIYVGPESYFQAGLRVGVSMLSAGDGLFQWDDNDPLQDKQNVRGSIPKIGAGLFYKMPNFYAGISAPDMVVIDSKKLLSDSSGKATVRKNYILTSGARMNISEYITFVPNVLLAFYPTRPLFANVNAGFEFNQTVTVGIGYTTPSIATVYGMVGLTPKIKVGYRYEIGLNQSSIGRFSTNEFMLSYGLN